MTFLDRLKSPKFDLTQNRSGGKMIKFQQSQALTSHYESFRSIVKWQQTTVSVEILGFFCHSDFT